MKPLLKLLFGSILFTILLATTCEDKDDCYKDDLDETVKTDYYAWGSVSITKSDGSDITAMYAGTVFRVEFNKIKCGGKPSSVNEYTYILLADGTLDKTIIGNIVIDMKNYLDDVTMTAYVISPDGTQGNLGTALCGYSTWKDGDINAEMTIKFNALEDDSVYWAGGLCNWEFKEFK